MSEFYEGSNVLDKGTDFSGHGLDDLVLFGVVSRSSILISKWKPLLFVRTCNDIGCLGLEENFSHPSLYVTNLRLRPPLNPFYV